MTADWSMSAAQAWARAVLNDRDLATAWALCDDDYRVALVQEWLLPRFGEVPDLVPEMASASPTSALWPEFAESLLATWTGSVTESIGRGPWEIFGMRLPEQERRVWVEPLAPDIELVRLAASGSTRTLLLQALMSDEGDLVASTSLLLRRRGTRWGVGGMRRCLAVPGWPPTVIRFDSVQEVDDTDDDT